MTEELEKQGPSQSLAALYAVLSFLHWVRGRFEDQLIAAERASQLAEEVGDESLRLEAEGRRALALLETGQTDKAMPVFEKVVRLAEPLAAYEVSARALLNMGVQYHLQGQLELAHTYYERTLDAAKKMGTPMGIAITLTNLGDLDLTRGEWTEARQYYEQAEAAPDSLTGTWIAAYPILSMGLLALYEGRWEDANRQLRKGLAIAENNEDLQAMRAIHASLAELEILQGHASRVVARLEPLLDRPGLEERQVIPLLTMLAWAHLESGNVEQACEMSRQAVGRTKAQNDKLALVEALRIQGMVCAKQKQWLEAQQAFEQAMSIAHAMPYPYAEARTCYEYGTMLCKKRDVKRGRRRLEEALSIFKRLGAMKDVERTEQALAQLHS